MRTISILFLLSFLQLVFISFTHSKGYTKYLNQDLHNKIKAKTTSWSPIEYEKSIFKDLTHEQVQSKLGYLGSNHDFALFDKLDNLISKAKNAIEILLPSKPSKE